MNQQLEKKKKQPNIFDEYNSQKKIKSGLKIVLIDKDGNKQIIER